jgi:rhodanese-related sulfurtransferase
MKKNKNNSNNMNKNKKLISKIILILLLLSFTVPTLLKIFTIPSNNNVKLNLNTKIHNISEYEGKTLLNNKNTIIIDVRTKEEYNEIRFKNSILMPVQNLSNYIQKLGKFKNYNIFLYCRTGNRSLAAAELFSHYGFKNIYNLKNGIINWKDTSYLLKN